jgi:glycolate oxidase
VGLLERIRIRKPTASRPGRASSKGLTRDLAQLLDRQRVRSDPEDLFAYAGDATYHLFKGKPDVVVLPETTEEVSRVVRYAFDHSVPVIPRGAGSGLSGGCTPIHGGIVMDMKRMRRILEINRGNMCASVEAGVVLGDFQHAVEKLGLFYPPNPQSMTICTLGGNVATRACGPHGVKYGSTADYVLGLEVVLPDGTVITPGGKVPRNSVGYDLTHLFTGSEGTLGVITRANLRLLAMPPARRTAVVVCESVDQAARTVSEIILGGILPAMIEFLPLIAVLAMNTFISPPLTTQGQAYLLMELDGTAEAIESQTARLRDLCRGMGTVDLRVVEDEREAATYWEARYKLWSMSLTVMKKVISEDVAVPRDRLPEFVRAVQTLSASMRKVILGVGGHAGDGNMHPNILFSELSEEAEKEAQAAIRQIVRTGLELGGTISGEHGIGLHKAEFLAWELGEAQVDLLKKIKGAIDPRGIMNPGKIWKQEGPRQTRTSP